MSLKHNTVYQISDIASLAQASVQQAYADIDPIINISHQMRQAGFAADTLTIERQQTQKRILMIFDDQDPDTVLVELGYSNEDPRMTFTAFALKDLSETLLFNWMVYALAAGNTELCPAQQPANDARTNATSQDQNDELGENLGESTGESLGDLGESLGEEPSDKR